MDTSINQDSLVRSNNVWTLALLASLSYTHAHGKRVWSKYFLHACSKYACGKSVMQVSWLIAWLILIHLSCTFFVCNQMPWKSWTNYRDKTKTLSMRTYIYERGWLVSETSLHWRVPLCLSIELQWHSIPLQLSLTGVHKKRFPVGIVKQSCTLLHDHWIHVVCNLSPTEPH